MERLAMRRPQFSLKTLFCLMVVVGAFFAGSAWQSHRLAQERLELEAENRAYKEDNYSLYQQINRNYRWHNRSLIPPPTPAFKKSH